LFIFFLFIFSFFFIYLTFESIAGPYIFVIGEGFLVDTSMVSGSGSAWPLRSSPADMFELSKGAMRLAAAYDLDRTWTLR